MQFTRIVSGRLVFTGLAALCATLACTPKNISQPLAQRLLGAWSSECTTVTAVHCSPKADDTCNPDNSYNQCIGIMTSNCTQSNVRECQASGCIVMNDEMCN